METESGEGRSEWRRRVEWGEVDGEGNVKLGGAKGKMKRVDWGGADGEGKRMEWRGADGERKRVEWRGADGERKRVE